MADSRTAKESQDKKNNTSLASSILAAVRRKTTFTKTDSSLQKGKKSSIIGSTKEELGQVELNR
jgi:hypothetical protein